jgi:hypothetical protein
VPVAAFVALGKVLVALHDGEIHSADEDDAADQLETAESDSDEWSSTDEDEDGNAPTESGNSMSPEMGSPQGTGARSLSVSPASRSPVVGGGVPPGMRPAAPPRPKLKARITAALKEWVEVHGAAAAPFLTTRHRRSCRSCGRAKAAPRAGSERWLTVSWLVPSHRGSAAIVRGNPLFAFVVGCRPSVSVHYAGTCRASVAQVVSQDLTDGFPAPQGSCSNSDDMIVLNSVETVASCVMHS